MPALLPCARGQVDSVLKALLLPIGFHSPVQRQSTSFQSMAAHGRKLKAQAFRSRQPRKEETDFYYDPSQVVAEIPVGPGLQSDQLLNLVFVFP